MRCCGNQQWGQACDASSCPLLAPSYARANYCTARVTVPVAVVLPEVPVRVTV